MAFRLVACFGVALVLATAASGTASGPLKLSGTVTHVVDGDTLDLRLGSGASQRVRLIGIDTPERGECYSRRATAFARDLAGGKRAVVWGDPTQSRRDRYGRILGYVWVRGGRDLGFQLLARGLARVYVYERAFARLRAYRYAESLGRRLRRSLWRGCGSSAPGSRRCDRSYPTVCIPSPPPDLDCADVRYRNFRVVGADPHRFDGNRDGRGCEP